MTPLGRGEVVQILLPARGGIPTAFIWRGRRHLVRAVEACEAESRRTSSGSERRRKIRLRTASGMRCLLSHDLRRSRWQMEGVLNGGGQRG